MHCTRWAAYGAPGRAAAPTKQTARAASVRGWKQSLAVLSAYSTFGTSNKGERLLLQNHHKPDLINDCQTELLKFSHHDLKLFFSDVTGMSFHDDGVSILQNIGLLAHQIVLQAFNITHQIEFLKSTIVHQIAEGDGVNGNGRCVTVPCDRTPGQAGGGTKSNG